MNAPFPVYDAGRLAAVCREFDLQLVILFGSRATGREDKITRLTYRETFLRLAGLDVYPEDFAEEIAGSAGLRTILVHDYNDVDRRIVYGAIRTGLEQYRQYVEHVRAFLDSLSEEPPADA